MAITFAKATKKKARARVALIGPSGSGKTYTALKIARGLGERVAVIDTERGSASKYADEFAFEVLELETYGPERYIEAIEAAAAAGFDVLVVDSLSHAWAGKDGVLEQVDNAKKRTQSQNSFTAWRDVTPLHNRLVDAIIQAPLHVIATMRTKTEYVMEKDERTGKTVPKKIGLQPIQRDGFEYEFDVVADIDLEHNLMVSKTRCRALDGAVIAKPDEKLAATLKAWLTDGAEASAPASAPAPAKQAPAQGKATTNAPPPQFASDAERRRFFAVMKEAGLEIERVIGADDGKEHAAITFPVVIQSEVFGFKMAVSPQRRELRTLTRKEIRGLMEFVTSTGEGAAADENHAEAAS